VHEAYLRLIDQQQVNWKNRAQFFGLAAEMMRRILMNHARKREADKRGGKFERVSLSRVASSTGMQDVELIALDDAMKQLAEMDPRKSRIVELKFFGGLTTEEIAELLQISVATVERDWGVAKTWLFRWMKGK
jgi:RNA polymerase sigma factor (TIGR02999 family)